MSTPPFAAAPLVLAALLALGAPTLLGSCSKTETPASSTAGTKTYTTKGTIKNFGPDKKFVSIAHENIPNYMAAMTMSFEPMTPTRLDGLQAGDKVEFSFFEDAASGKRLISSIKKTP